MDTLWNAEIEVLLWFQEWPAWLHSPMQALSALGSAPLYLGIAPLIFWCISASVGARLNVLLMTTSVVNLLCKSLVYGPRPYWLSSMITPTATESSFGIPSGHSQMAVSMWGYLAAKIHKRWAWVAAGTLIMGIMLSRLYFGVHFISDVVVGMLLGIALLCAALHYEDRLLSWWRRRALVSQLGTSAILSLLAPLIAVLWQTLVRTDWSAPAAWSGRTPDDAPAETLSTLFQIAGMLFGLLAALSLLWRRGWYSAAGSVIQRGSRGIIGLAGMAVIILGLRFGVPSFDGSAGFALEYLSAAVIMIWAFFVLPEIFVHSKLARRIPTHRTRIARAASTPD